MLKAGPRHHCRPASRDRKAGGRLSSLVALPHRFVGALDVSAKAIGVEERTAVPVSSELRPLRREQVLVPRQPQRQSFVVFEGVGNQLGQTHGVQQAARHPPGKARPETGHDRQPRPQSVARRRVGIVRNVVEKQVSQAMPRQVIFQPHPRGKDQPIRVDAPHLRIPPQVANRGGVALQEPQHAALDLAQQPHPRIEHRRRDLVIVVERAEHKSGLGQPRLRPGWRILTDGPLRIIGLVRIRQVNNFLRVRGVLVFGDNEPVGKDVIDIVHAHRARIAEIIDLNRRRSKRQYSGAATLRVPF